MAHKYHAQPTVVDGHRFASKKEANRFCELRLLQRAGQISKLKLQPVYPIFVASTHVFDYVADFQYEEGAAIITEDVKGYKTDVYRIKKKCFQAMYSHVFRET